MADWYSAVVPNASHNLPCRNAASSAATRGAAPCSVPGGTLSTTPRALAAASAPTAQNAERQPNCWPTRVPSGTPATFATVSPPRSTASDLARSCGTTTDTVTTAATAQNAPVATAVTTRAASRSPYCGARALTTCPTTNTPRAANSVVRRGSRSVSTAIAGAPTIIPTANAEIR
jgi:hypothetical protein